MTVDPRFESLSDAERVRLLALVFAMVAIYSMGLGLSAPLISLSMERLGASRTEIGLNTAVAALAILAVAPLVPRLLARYGMRRVVPAALVLSTAALLLFKASESHLLVWYPLRFVFTGGIASCFVVSESFINQLAAPATRGRLLGLYTTAGAAGFALGALLLSGLGSAGAAPYLAGAAIFLAAAAASAASPLLDRARMRTSGADPVRGLARRHWLAMSAALIFGVVEVGGASLIPVYALHMGHSEAVGAQAVSALAFGYVALPLATGLLADRYGVRPLLLATTALTFASVLLMPFAAGSIAFFYLDMVLAGGASAGLYVLGLAKLVETLSPEAIAPANAAFVSVYGLGALVGPLTCGLAMDIWDPNGLVGALAALVGTYLFLLLAVPAARPAVDRGAHEPH